ncbi:hypothetical protein BST97_02415 [Nonlabens spongiae]|uniref:DUF559 domain-containing protein n=1 Tax=Nonlabens spongiae TaxID=331648 RepID=A0A1W6MH61_9FLAO|nr:DUF559 domain-containing protein [Nonlabens spongiae]ARN76943.1 hypothetical protein BST97_02415 [Nonlabens spongiae]
MERYNGNLSIEKIFHLSGAGIVTAHDEFVIDFSKQVLEMKFQRFANSLRDTESLHRDFKVAKKKGWDILEGYDNLQNNVDFGKYIYNIDYRPFDTREIFYEDKLVWRTVRQVFDNINGKENYSLVLPKQNKKDWGVFISKFCTAHKLVSAYDINYNHPLYRYESNDRIPNLNRKMIQQFASGLSLTFLPDHDLERLREAVELREQGQDVYSGWKLPETVEDIEQLFERREKAQKGDDIAPLIPQGELLRGQKAKWKTADPRIYEVMKERAKELRKNMTATEKVFWQEIRANKLGVKFNRQHVAAGFILDFFDPEIGLAVEIDGGYHENQKEQDQLRTEELNAQGIQVIRFSNTQVTKNLLVCIRELQDSIDKIQSNTKDSPLGARGRQEHSLH